MTQIYKETGTEQEVETETATVDVDTPGLTGKELVLEFSKMVREGTPGPPSPHTPSQSL